MHQDECKLVYFGVTTKMVFVNEVLASINIWGETHSFFDEQGSLVRPQVCAQHAGLTEKE